jgi:hypothetical protein
MNGKAEIGTKTDQGCALFIPAGFSRLVPVAPPWASRTPHLLMNSCSLPPSATRLFRDEGRVTLALELRRIAHPQPPQSDGGECFGIDMFGSAF